jgi:hypothetical protein
MHLRHAWHAALVCAAAVAWFAHLLHGLHGLHVRCMFAAWSLPQPRARQAGEHDVTDEQTSMVSLTADERGVRCTKARKHAGKAHMRDEATELEKLYKCVHLVLVRLA